MALRQKRRAAGRMVMLLLVALLLVPAMPAWGVTEDATIPADLFEPDNSAEFASVIAVNGEPQHHTLSTRTDEDWTAFYAVAGNTYVIETGTPDIDLPVSLYDDIFPADTYMELYDAFGMSRLDSSEDMGDMGFSRIVFKATTSDYFLVRVTASRGFYIDALASAGEPAREDDGLGQYLLSVQKKTPSISGRVTNEDGEPVWDACVILGDEMERASLPEAKTAVTGDHHIHTDEQGRYYFFDIEDGEWPVYFDGGDYVPEYYDDAADIEDADLVTTTSGKCAEGIDAVLEEYPPDIYGVVRDEEGSPIAGTRVEAWYFCPWCLTYHEYTSTYTDADGSYELYVDEYYDYEVYFSGYDDWGYNRYEDEFFDNATDIETAETLYVPVDFSVDATLATLPQALSGKVTNEAGEPIDEVCVELYDTEGYYLGETYTSYDGKYGFSTDYASEDTTVVVGFYDYSGLYAEEWYDDAQDFDSADRLEIGPEDYATGIDAELAKGPPAISGIVTDEVTGKALEGVEVWLYAWDEYDVGWRVYDYAFTAEDGSYGFWQLWSEGPYRIRYFDRDEIYASEYFDNAPIMGMATDVWPWGGIGLGEGEGGFTADAALALKLPRISGSNRFTTALAAAESAFPGWEGVEDVVIACGDDEHMVDALSASGLCWAYDAPLLLVGSDSAPGEVIAAIKEIKAVSGAVDIHVVGSTDAVSASCANALDAAGGGALDRVNGANRYATAAAVADCVSEVASDTAREIPSTALVANGAEATRLWDALAFSAVSAKTGIPVLLTRKDVVPSETSGALAGTDEVIVGGGEQSVSAAVYKALGADARWSGANRYATATSVADKARAKGWLNGCNVAVSASLPDALTGGSLVGRSGGVLLLTSPDVLAFSTYNYLAVNVADITSCRVLGGPAAVSETVRDQITIALNP